ncbi:unnamed protein product (macronuclear) [Paramecium tetraurelia]|uniref:RAP domain-containing protein n=1 Tax=Paramecium tetraurelia TaxID=5888 RepID=A0DEY2_PARTE|nr:uncharacterized protein GSPATT00016425001 [Paramecium tetraurelia]CAK81599.1 unnamed protein product [Paramecium tetraurelia]|eukprot:XP_001448996.1 hypothetical protein (macronuclear) [Paramecium tetraurelia strain d4-2]
MIRIKASKINDVIFRDFPLIVSRSHFANRILHILLDTTLSSHMRLLTKVLTRKPKVIQNIANNGVHIRRLKGLAYMSNEAKELLKKYICDNQLMILKIRQLFSTIAEPVSGGKQWMKFFQNSTGIQINIERSLKNEASENLNYYVRQNYKTFNQEQLFSAYIKKDLQYEIQKQVQMEILERFAADQMNFNENMLITFLNKEAQMLPAYYSVIAQNLLLNGLKIFDQLSIYQQIEYMRLCLQSGFLHGDILQKFIKNLKIDDEFIESLSLLQFKNIMTLFTHCAKSPYDFGLQPGFIDYLCNKYIQKLSNFELVASEIMKYEFSQLMINYHFSFLSDEQFSEIKIAYARILERMFNKNYNFIVQRNLNTKDIVQKLLQLYQPEDFKLLQISLTHLITNTINLGELKADHMIYSLPLYFRYFSPQLYSLLLKQCQKQNQNYKISKYDIRQFMFLLNNNVLKGFRTIMEDKSPLDDVENYMKSSFSQYLSNIKDEELMIFEDTFNPSMEQDTELDFNDSEYAEILPYYLNNYKTQETQNQINQRQFLNNLTLKFKSLQKSLQQSGFQRISIQKTNKRVSIIEPVLSYIEVLYYASILIPEFQPQTKIFKTPQMFKLMNNLINLPNLLEHLFQVKQTWPNLFNEELKSIITTNKAKIDEIYNTCQDCQEFIDKVEGKIDLTESHKSRKLLYTNKAYQGLLQLFNFARPKPHNKLSPILKNPYEEYTIEETYSDQEVNLYWKLSQRSDNLIQHTHFKELVWQAIKLDKNKWIMNYSDFPHLVDFACPKQKVVVLLEEYPRLIRGLHKVYTVETERAVEHFSRLGYQVVFIDYNVYHPDTEQMLNILKQKFVFRYN